MTGFDEDLRFEHDKPERIGTPVDVARLFGALKHGKDWLLGAVVVGVVAGIVLAESVGTPRYEASAFIAWEPELGAENRIAPHRQELHTLLESVKLPTNLEQIGLRLGLPSAVVARSLRVEPKRHSNVLAFGAERPTGRAAAALANTAVDVFAEQQRRLGSERRKEIVASLQRDRSAAEAKLRAARTAYDAFRAKLGVTGVPEAVEATTAELLAAEATVERLRGEIEAFGASEASYRSRREQQSSRVELGTRVSNPARAQLAEAEAKLATDLRRLAPDSFAAGSPLAIADRYFWHVRSQPGARRAHRGVARCKHRSAAGGSEALGYTEAARKEAAAPERAQSSAGPGNRAGHAGARRR